VRQQGAAYGVMSVHRHGDNHVGGAEHPEDLQVFHQATQEVRAWKASCNIPHELGQHLREGEEGGGVSYRKGVPSEGVHLVRACT